MRGTALLLTGLALGIAAPASARDLDFNQMSSGDFTTAEARLERAHALSPDSAEWTLNLAAVYAYTGRPAAARGLYRDVLDHNAVELTLASGASVTSHDVARRGLARLTRTTIASR